MVSLLLTFVAILLGSIALIYPGWYWAKHRYNDESRWPLCLPPSGIALWLVLGTVQVGPQSLANFIEIPFVAIAAVLAAYLKFFVCNRSTFLRPRGDNIATIVVVGIVLGLRFLMPNLPE